MRQMQIDGITVNAPEDISYDELKAYVDYCKTGYMGVISLDIELDGEYANLTIHAPNRPFEHIRRITDE